MKEPGYVYILTNPSFKEDWVKIGKSSRPVDVRSKELDNTAVPLPFEIYATLQTTKYNEVEKLVHKTIDRLTDLRIRQNREFFNVRPGVALDILRDIASTLDDAVINSYNHGDVIHIARKDADKDSDRVSGTRKQKDVFWKGYIETMRNNPTFLEHFRLSERLPRYSYDLRIGTSACNIYQAATMKKLAVGLYFHGKDLFSSIIGFRKKMDAIVGTETEWTEYDKDCSIQVSREFALQDETSYQDAYSWLLEYAVKIKTAYEQAIAWLETGETVEGKEEDIDEEGNDEEATKTGRRARFRFSMVGIRVGEELTFIPTGIRVKVASDDQIEYDGRLYKLSPFVGTFMPADKLSPSRSYQGPKYFSYKGKTLNDLRVEEETNTDIQLG